MGESRMFDCSILFQDYEFDTPEEAARAFIDAIVELYEAGADLYVDLTDSDTGEEITVKVRKED